MRSRLGLVLSMGLMAFQIGTASAQSPAATSAPVTSVPAMGAAAFGRGKLDTVCATSLTRFCPDLAATPGQTRNQVICLKPYRTSLPLACRSAVTAAMH